jgi:hypothetical protein
LTSLSGGTASWLGAGQTLGSSHQIFSTRALATSLPIEDCQLSIAKLKLKSAIGNCQLAMLSAN